MDEEALVNKQIKFSTNIINNTKVINQSAMTSVVNMVPGGLGTTDYL